MDLAANLSAVQQRIEAACGRAGRNSSSVMLLPVTKSQPPELVSEAARLGLTIFGESKIQEAKAKIPMCPGRLRWQMIGHLQSNKCRDAVELFEMIQSVDSLPLAQEINKRAEQAAKRMPILLEVNVVGEASKFGYRPEDLLAELSRVQALPRLEIQGLMTVPPWTPEAEKTRRVFRELRELKQQCEAILDAPLPHLSMGMTGDFEVAIDGTGLFGARGSQRH